MIITTVGRPKNVPVKICKEALKFYGEHLLGKRLYDKIELTLEFCADDLGTTVYGFCDWNDDNHKARDFTIIIHPNLSKKTMLTVLAHEMVHVKQYAKGEMKDYARKNSVKFNGKIYNDDEMDYWDYPWEVEAHGREKGLYYRFINNMKE